ncbi:MerR-like DNA binding protein [Palleronia aestuarii]|uniref:MerR-like DNA binding protein n=1 Tax=Palleronia aestuarii TaxID=568105 RepID=A0A2W7N8J8_9RHOB|nr:MerR family transcriptional regulator [Palleronia aestuarii]PZX16003.1 MerR-like DNA binding protein [Palleronia aestuarii]
MSKSPDAFRTISEVATWLEVPTHVLRFWESRFSQVKPIKRAGGRRYYRPADMRLLGGIKQLLHDDGLTIRGAQKLLREQGVHHVCSLSRPLDPGLERAPSEPDRDDVQENEYFAFVEDCDAVPPETEPTLEAEHAVDEDMPTSDEEHGSDPEEETRPHATAVGSESDASFEESYPERDDWASILPIHAPPSHHHVAGFAEAPGPDQPFVADESAGGETLPPLLLAKLMALDPQALSRRSERLGPLLDRARELARRMDREDV